jgi:hypothetical protein
MPRPHHYTTASLEPDHPAFVVRTPGFAEFERLFPSPSSSGRGRLAVEGGISVVAGPGMGKTSLLAQVARELDLRRGVATALVKVPAGARFPGDDGFYVALGEIVANLRAGLQASPRLLENAFKPVADALTIEPTWDVQAPARGMSPRGMERWIADLGNAAVRTPGICLLFDDVDHVNTMSWKNAFVAALRFTFQTCAGITPVYAVWNLFADESLPGSNYFRNVTRPFFLEPLAANTIGSNTNERRALVDVDLASLREEAAAEVFRLGGGQPKLLHRLLGDLCNALDSNADVASLGATEVRALVDRNADAQRALARELIEATPPLAVALREIVKAPNAPRTLSRGLHATGVVDLDHAGRPLVAERVREVL